MKQAAKKIGLIMMSLLIALTLVQVMPVSVQAAASYTVNAAPASGLPGVYIAKARPGDRKETATMGIPSISKDALANKPTTESPAIITGAAVNYEKKTGPINFEPIPGASLVAPYSYFRYGFMEEQRQEADGSITTHTKLSGFDGSYYIIRVDLSDLLATVSNPEGKYLHVKQESNKALMVAIGMDGTTFADGLGSKTGSYPLANGFRALKDTTGNDQNTPYLDVILMSSGLLAAGADTGMSGALSADVGLSFYVDDTADYDPTLTYDPTSQDTNHAQNCLKKFYREEAASAGTAEAVAGYTVKGSDLEIDVTVDESQTSDGIAEYWSLTKAIDYQSYDSHIIRLICEAPVLEGLQIKSTDGQKRSVILDVNSFDIQIANHAETNKAGLTISKDAELKLMDGTQTAGAELAIGNNATMVVEKDGVLIVDESCVTEVEYDAATTTGGTTPPTLQNGEIVIKDGGRIVNYGVINVEGTEGKPLDPNPQSETPATDIRSAVMIIQPGGVLENHGCLSVKGILYVLGSLTNDGNYNDIINSRDPDKGIVAYHKGIQVTWKDDVTREGVKPGEINIGIDADGTLYRQASVTNSGDIVVTPGSINLYGSLTNTGHVYLTDVSEAIIPLQPTQEAPLVVEKRISLDPPRLGMLNVDKEAALTGDAAGFSGAVVELIHNGVLGTLTPTGDARGRTADIRAADRVLSAKDNTGKDLVQGTDYNLVDGGVSFLPAYYASLPDVRTVRINIGYRFYEFKVSSAGPVKEMPFTDVAEGTWYYDSVFYVFNRNIMTGMTPTYFGVSEKLSRAQFATVLYRVENPQGVTYSQKFPDVKESDWFGLPVSWASDCGVITGYQNGRFGPADNITREQIAVMLYRYANYKKYDTSMKADLSKYPDAKKVSSWATEAMQWAVGCGIISGKSGTYLDPTGNAQRVECAAMIERFMKKYE